MSSASAYYAKWTQTISTSIARATAYKVDFFLQVIGPSLFFYFIKYNLWSRIYNGDSAKIIGGFTLNAMLLYQAWVLVCEFLVKAQTGANLSEEIRMGRISNYLIYPFSFWKFHFASFIGFQIIQTFIVLVTLGTLTLSGLITEWSILTVLQGIIMCYMVSVLWFSIQFMTGIAGFWLEETWILRVSIEMTALFLSGSIVPLSFFPEGLEKILAYTPFPYMVSFPVKVFMGEPVNWSMALSIVGLWFLLFHGMGLYMWRRGLRLYTAAGM